MPIRVQQEVALYPIGPVTLGTTGLNLDTYVSPPADVIPTPNHWLEGSGGYAHLQGRRRWTSGGLVAPDFSSGGAPYSRRPDVAIGPDYNVYVEVRYQSRDEDWETDHPVGLLVSRNTGGFMEGLLPKKVPEGSGGRVRIRMQPSNGRTLEYALNVLLNARSDPFFVRIMTGRTVRPPEQPGTKLSNLTVDDVTVFLTIESEIPDNPPWVPPCRLHARDDLHALGGARLYPPSKMNQTSVRQFGAY